MRTIHFNTIQEANGNLLIIPICKGETVFPFIEMLDRETNGAIRLNLQIENFTGEKHQLLLMTTNGLYRIPKILFVGLGLKENLTKASLQEIGGFIASAIGHLPNTEKVALDATQFEKEEGEVNIPFGILMKEWRFNKYKNRGNPVVGSFLQCLCRSPCEAKDRFAYYDSLYAGISTARELTSEPANYVYPQVSSLFHRAYFQPILKYQPH